MLRCETRERLNERRQVIAVPSAKFHARWSRDDTAALRLGNGAAPMDSRDMYGLLRWCRPAMYFGWRISGDSL